MQVAVPSRQGVLEYQNLRDEVERLVGSVNGSFGQLGRPVVHYLHAELRQDDLVAVYLAADIMMVTPGRRDEPRRQGVRHGPSG